MTCLTLINPFNEHCVALQYYNKCARIYICICMGFNWFYASLRVVSTDSIDASILIECAYILTSEILAQQWAAILNLISYLFLSEASQTRFRMQTHFGVQLNIRGDFNQFGWWISGTNLSWVFYWNRRFGKEFGGSEQICTLRVTVTRACGKTRFILQ